MKAPTRIYIVTNTQTGEQIPVEESHPSNAIRAITDDLYKVTTPTTSELATLLETGVKVIRPKAAAQAEPV